MKMDLKKRGKYDRHLIINCGFFLQLIIAPMPISGTKTGTASKTPSVASKTSTAADKPAAKPTGNVASRAPWLKDAGKTTATTQSPWAKKATPATPADKSNGLQKEVKLQSREIKVPVVTQRKVSIPVEPLVKPKPVKVTVPEDNYETSSSEYEEVTDSEEEVTETESDSSLEEVDDEDKHKMPIQVKLKPVEKPPEVKKSPSVDRAGKFVKPALKKVPTLDKLNKPKAPPPTIPESKPLRHVDKPILPEEPAEKNFEFQRPQLRKADSITKKRKCTFCFSFVFVFDLH